MKKKREYTWYDFKACPFCGIKISPHATFCPYCLTFQETPDYRICPVCNLLTTTFKHQCIWCGYYYIPPYI